MDDLGVPLFSETPIYTEKKIYYTLAFDFGEVPTELPSPMSPEVMEATKIFPPQFPWSLAGMMGGSLFISWVKYLTGFVCLNWGFKNNGDL